MSDNPLSANEAVDDYLQDLLSDGELAIEQQQQAVAKKATPSKPRLYQLSDHPQRKTELNKTDLNTDLNRAKIDRAEKLLKQFQEQPVATEKVVLTPPVLKQAEQVQLEPKQEAKQDLLTEMPIETPVEPPAPNLPIEQQPWTQEPFQTLLFESAGLTLAVPLVMLGGIHRITESPTSIFGKPDWFMGLTPHLDGNINVVDTARWVMPEKYQQAEQQGLNYKYIIILGDSRWGLACGEVHDAMNLDPNKVKWRSGNTKRPWLAGLLVDEMCALLDVDKLIELLDKNFPR
jgi:purine-binding chemotaxis protein CheW